MRSLIETLLDEKRHGIKGGIYNKLQVDFAYNSNHIEGSKLTHEQTKYIYETQTVGLEPARVEDIFEAVNHFRCFDTILETFGDPITESYIKKLHFQLKNGTLSAESPHAVVGNYKKYPNYVGAMKTVAPNMVQKKISVLLCDYETLEQVTLFEILKFHADFEKIHPFYDGNGRIGRLIMFKECLRQNIVPFLIEDTYKGYYYHGLKEWQKNGEKGFLIDTCLLMQDNMKLILDYFQIDYDKTLINRKMLLEREKNS